MLPSNCGVWAGRVPAGVKGLLDDGSGGCADQIRMLRDMLAEFFFSLQPKPPKEGGQEHSVAGGLERKGGAQV